ncbi:hypothetical protein MMC19_004811 [Ptychographa xylographoides]|nr:hypothetical protein [Ptychographa xylographoides]
MERRSHESPMEFEYDNKGGRVDSNSPFLRNGAPRLASFKTDHAVPNSFDRLTQASSPSRTNGAQPKQFPQTPTMKPATIFPFSGMRDTSTFDFSSGPENQSSPENADNDETPEPTRHGIQAFVNENVTVDRGHRTPSPTKRFSLTDTLKRFSPSRSNFRKRHDRELVSKRVHKRKRRELERDNQISYRRPSDSSGSEEKFRSEKGPNSSQTFYPNLHAILDTLTKYPYLPHLISYYAQTTMNLVYGFALCYLAYTFWATIRSDVDMKTEEQAIKMMADMAVCAREYIQNRCNVESRVPAMETLCENWDSCMNRDPYKVGRARVSAQTFAEIFNSFIEPISLKAMIFILTLIFGTIYISNFAFNSYRKTQPTPPEYRHPYQYEQVQDNGRLQYHTPMPERKYLELLPAGELGHENGNGNGNGNGSRSPSKSYGYR